MKKKIWRLSSAPTVEDLKTAIEAGIITKEEAKEMLLREEDEIPKDHKDHKDQLEEIKDELKFLREMVLELAKREPEVVYKHIYEYWRDRPYYPRWGSDWYTLSCNTAKILGDNVTYNAMNSITTGTGLTDESFVKN